MTRPPRRDRLRELLDAVLADGHDSLDAMADGAHSSPFHFSRQVRRGARESPVAMRRRVLLERAAWRLAHGAGVTEVAFEAEYDSVDGFARAFGKSFGHNPSTHAAADTGRLGHWLDAPNGIHFHSPTVLYVDSDESTVEGSGDLTMLMVRHDLDDTSALLDAAKGLDEPDYRRSRLPGHAPVSWRGPEEGLHQVLAHLVTDKQPWLNSIRGEDTPAPVADDIGTLIAVHERSGPAWLALIRDIDRRGSWSDRIVDALCDPPESFVLSQIVAHVLTFAAHRRQLARWMLADAGIELSEDLDPDPITWHRRQSGGF